MWNTTATDITADDFVLIDGSYNSSSLSGVTISTDAALASDSTLVLNDSEDSSLQDSDTDTDNGFINTGLIDDSSGFSFDNINSPDPIFEIDNFEDILSESSSSIDDNLVTIVIEEIEEEEILLSIDII